MREPNRTANLCESVFIFWHPGFLERDSGYSTADSLVASIHDPVATVAEARTARSLKVKSHSLSLAFRSYLTSHFATTRSFENLVKVGVNDDSSGEADSRRIRGDSGSQTGT